MQIDNVELCGNFGYNNTELIENNNFSWNIFPNPSNGHFEINTNRETSNSLIEIYSIVGEKIFETKLNNKLVVNVKPPPGTYLIRLTSDNFIEEKVLIIK